MGIGAATWKLVFAPAVKSFKEAKTAAKQEAENQETENQLKHLCNLGCDLIQGYYFSRPVPENEVVGVIKDIAQRSLPTPTKHAA